MNNTLYFNKENISSIKHITNERYYWAEYKPTRTYLFGLIVIKDGFFEIDSWFGINTRVNQPKNTHVYNNALYYCDYMRIILSNGSTIESFCNEHQYDAIVSHIKNSAHCLISMHDIKEIIASTK